MQSLVNVLSGIERELESLNPEDRMGLFVAISRAVDAIATSAGGWRQLLTNPTVLEEFDQATLRGFFDYFREEAVRQLEFDTKVLNEHADVIGARLALQPLQPPRFAYG